MLALLVFSYACCGIGVWFGWYLRGRRPVRIPLTVVYGDALSGSPASRRARADEIVRRAHLRIVTAQDSTE